MPSARPILLLISAVVLALSSRAATYHVAPGGSNADAGLTPETAWATLQHAANTMQPGDTVLVADGTYAGCNITRSGASGSPITYRATGLGARITTPNTFTGRDGINIEGADWIVIDGFDCSGLERAGIRAVLGDHIVIRRTTCADNGRWGIFTGFTDDLLLEFNHCSGSVAEHGIYVSNSSDRAVIRHNRSHHNHGGGIQINADATMGGDGLSSDCRIHDNVIWENGVGGGAAINLDGAINARIYNNVLYENHATGIALFQVDAAASSRGAWIVNNTIVQAANGRWCILAVDGATGLTLRHNILVTGHSFRGALAIDAASRLGLSSDYNVLVDRMSGDAGDTVQSLAAWRTATGQDAHSRVAPALDALFPVRASGDYRPAAASNAVDAGLAEADADAARDALGVPRPQGTAVDAGAFERVPSGGGGASGVRVHNLSTRAETTSGEPVIAGFVIGGTGTCTVLIRVAGPRLVPLGVSSALADPELRLYAGATVLASNDDWQSDPQAGAIASTASAVGAFAFAAGSADSAVLATLGPGAYTVHALAKSGAASGVVLVELYDASPEPATARLINVSTRALAGRGEATVIPGLIISGGGSVLLRAVGPGLESHGVSAFLRDPLVRLYRGDAVVATNDTWSLDAEAGAAAVMMAQTGAFALRGGSEDAALRATLTEGRYTLHAVPAGDSDARGVVLVEVYAP
ncbi:MAG: right-handed parallel beta-helix repeat-containing protein [Opitutaceae bacterium]|nr:right-handed parallel beta-helix repeat-containing protein [Opitutaceae bacterium]